MYTLTFNFFLIFNIKSLITSHLYLQQQQKLKKIIIDWSVSMFNLFLKKMQMDEEGEHGQLLQPIFSPRR